MKKGWWLFVFPYVVSVSSYTVQTNIGDYKVGDVEHVQYSVGPIITEDKDFADDFAEAMNEAHKRRLAPLEVVIPKHQLHPAYEESSTVWK